MNRRVLVIGLDGATWDVLNPLLRDGEMPHLKKLLDRSAQGVLMSSIPPVTAAAWTCFSTGKNPGKHGLVDFIYFPEHGYRVTIANSTTREAATLWNLLSDRDLRVGVVSVPMTYPPEPVNGVMVTDMMTPNANVQYTYPPELKQELLDKVGPFVITPGEGENPSEPLTYLDKVRQDVKGSADYALYLLKKEPYSFFMYVFGIVDILQHQFWYLIEADPKNLNEQDRALRDKVVDIFTEVDNGVGEMVKSADDETTIVLMSDHGFGPMKGFMHVNNFLLDQGYLVLKSGGMSAIKRALFRAGLTPQNVHLTLKALKLDLRRKVNRGRAYGMLRRFFLSFDDVDWTKTRAFALGHIGQIYINLKGRQPSGIVAPGADYEKLRDEIRAELLKLKHPATGEQLIARVLNREEIYHGDLLDNTPDLLLLPADFKYVAFGESEFASNKLVGPTLGHTGHHRLEGIGALIGPHVQVGAQIQNASLVDLAPTILYALGLPIPPDMDGRVLTEAFTSEFVNQTALNYDTANAVRTDFGGTYSDDEEEQVIQRLADLGYVS
ncbi:MAG: alkaline phosphatase family protein [Chloroflexi bacterium]|nr:alkaline phosphatase family protein [Chloroflexota bacterium]MBI4760297.1 alkaline phosphatase family protein [Chloroflexota bacterium]